MNYVWREVDLLAENLAEGIREQEAMAKRTIAEANVESANILASAQAEAEQLIKSNKQLCHRQWREKVAETEEKADAEAKNIFAKGEEEAKLYYEEKKDSVEAVAKWLVKEVVASYGSHADE